MRNEKFVSFAYHAREDSLNTLKPLPCSLGLMTLQPLQSFFVWWGEKAAALAKKAKDLRPPNRGVTMDDVLCQHDDICRDHMRHYSVITTHTHTYIYIYIFNPWSNRCSAWLFGLPVKLTGVTGGPERVVHCLFWGGGLCQLSFWKGSTCSCPTSEVPCKEVFNYSPNLQPHISLKIDI